MEERDPGFTPPPLPYAPPPPGRPGMITAVGILSLIIGGLSGLSSVSGILRGIVYIALSGSGALPTASVATTGPTTAPSPTTMVTTSSGGTTTIYYSASASAPSPFRLKMSRPAAILSLVEAGCSLLVAMMLAVGGIAVLADWRRATSLHRLYVVLKLPLAVLAGFASWWMMAAIMKSFGQPGPAGVPFPGFDTLIAVSSVVGGFLFSAAYPIALIFVLRSRTWREYFASIESGAVG